MSTLRSSGWLATNPAEDAGAVEKETWGNEADLIGSGWLRSRQASCTP
jgi:hypothetical protein